MLSSFRFSFTRITRESIMTYSINREARMLDKLLRKGLRKQTSSKKLSAEFFRPEQESFSRKGAALNKVYMEHVSEALALGKSSDLLVELGIQITKVLVTNDRKTIKAYWTCTKDVQEEEILEALHKASGDVRNHINELRYIGKIPELRFIKDKEAEGVREIERLLSVADFGRDFQPNYPSPAFKSGPGTDIEEPLPPMRQDVLGLDHGKITRRLLARVDKERIKVSLPKGKISFDEPEESSTKTIPFDKEIYRRFFRKKYNQEMKQKKEMKAKAYGTELTDEFEEQYEDEVEYEYEKEDKDKEQGERDLRDDFEEELGSKDWKPPFVK